MKNYQILLLGEINFTSYKLPLSLFASMNNQDYLKPPMNYHFVTKNPLSSVKVVKLNS